MEGYDITCATLLHWFVTLPTRHSNYTVHNTVICALFRSGDWYLRRWHTVQGVTNCLLKSKHFHLHYFVLPKSKYHILEQSFHKNSQRLKTNMHQEITYTIIYYFCSSWITCLIYFLLFMYLFIYLSFLFIYLFIYLFSYLFIYYFILFIYLLRKLFQNWAHDKYGILIFFRLSRRVKWK